MVYRIHFETKGSYWCIQFRNLFRWTTVLEAVAEPSGPTAHPAKKTFAVKTFATFEAATDYTIETGIAEAYNQKTAKTAYSPVSSGVSEFPVPRGYQLVAVQR